MKIFISVPEGRCAACEFEIPGRPVVRHDQAFCCAGCASGAPCLCLYDEEQASDAVDGLGLAFPVAAPAPVEAPIEAPAVRTPREPELAAARA
jgi:hypothetical protein